MLYCRQSDSGGDGVESLSIESQELRLRQYAESHGWSVLAVERDADLRGWQDEDERPGLAAALRRAEEDGDVLLVWDLSRLARKLRIQENIVARLADAGVEIASLNEPWASAPMFRQILGAVAEERTRQMSVDIRRSLRQRAQTGLWHGIVPYGYVRPAGKNQRLGHRRRESRRRDRDLRARRSRRECERRCPGAHAPRSSDATRWADLVAEHALRDS